MRQDLEEALAELLNERVDHSSAVSGGDINQAFRVRTPSRTIFVKLNENAPAHMFERERKGLELLRSAGPLRVPEVLGLGALELGSGGRESFLILEWIDSGTSRQDFSHQFGTALAELHRNSGSQFGLDHDNFIGSLPQKNSQSPTWLTFFRDQRLGAQLEIAKRTASLSTATLQRADKLLGQLDKWLPGQSTPSLLHGDLWGGNYMVAANGEAVLIDPAVYYGDREIEIAFTQLFGGFDTTFYDAYQSNWPLPQGHQTRRDLYNLYPLLVHANLFGGGYASRVDAVVRRYA